MTSTQRRRLMVIMSVVLAIAMAVGLTLYALKQNISLFYTPTQIAAGEPPEGQMIRMGGLVVLDSVNHDTESLKVNFAVTDNNEAVIVYYEGILPDLFREGQGIVVQGRLDKNGDMQATQVLAKHDENYIPPEVAASLQAQHNKAKAEAIK